MILHDSDSARTERWRFGVHLHSVTESESWRIIQVVRGRLVSTVMVVGGAPRTSTQDELVLFSHDPVPRSLMLVLFSQGGVLKTMLFPLPQLMPFVWKIPLMVSMEVLRAGVWKIPLSSS